jgi:hypothetical protein
MKADTKAVLFLQVFFFGNAFRYSASNWYTPCILFCDSRQNPFFLYGNSFAKIKWLGAFLPANATAPQLLHLSLLFVYMLAYFWPVLFLCTPDGD